MGWGRVLGRAWIDGEMEQAQREREVLGEISALHECVARRSILNTRHDTVAVEVTDG